MKKTIIDFYFLSAKQNKKICKAKFVSNSRGNCEIVNSDHPELDIRSFTLNGIRVAVGDKLMAMTKFKYNPEKRKGSIWFEL